MLDSRASLRVYSSTLSLVEITNTIGVESSKGYSVNEPWDKYPDRIRKDSLWLKHSTLADDVELVEHLLQHLNFIENRKDIFLSLRDKCEIDLFCFLGSDNGQGGIYIPHNISKRLSELEIDLIVDIHI